MVKLFNNMEQIRRKVYYNSPHFIQKSFWNICLFYIRVNRYKNIMSRNGYIDNDNNIIYVNPEKIKYSLIGIRSGEKFKNLGKVEDGDWDLKCPKFEDSELFKSLKDHFIEGVPLIKTELYSNILRKMECGEIYWGCKTKEDLENRMKKIDEIYVDIKTNGYMTQKDLGRKFYLDEISVNISRNGELIFEDGGHRFSIAKILELKSIPVIITRRHYQWVKFGNNKNYNCEL